MITSKFLCYFCCGFEEENVREKRGLESCIKRLLLLILYMESILKFYIRLILFLLPWFFVPQMYNSFGLAKSGLLIIGGVVGLMIWLIEFLIKKNEVIKWNGLLSWFLVLVMLMGISFLTISSGAKARSMISSSGFGSFVGLLMWLFLWIQIDDKKERMVQFKWLSVSGIVVAIGSLITFMIPGSKLPLVWPKSDPILSIGQNWSLVGSLIGEAVLMLILIIGWLKILLIKLKEKEDFNNYLTEAMGVVFFGLILFLDVYKIIKLGWGYLDIKTTWIIAVESLKNSPLLGIGIGNFYQAFLLFKPLSFNLTKFWSSVFETSSIGLLNLWTEMGILGLGWVLFGLTKLLKKIRNNNFILVFVASLLILLLPIEMLTLVLIFWVFVISGLWTSREVKMKLLVSEKNINVMPYIVGFLLLIGIGFAGYWEARIIVGDIYWMKSVKAASKNDGSGAYNNQIKAIGMNPNMADYRAVYSQTCLALSQNFLTKENLTDADKEQGTVLIQQSVREAKAAIGLDKNNSGYWSNLGAIYKSLIGLVEGAGTWSVQAYQQAVVLNPNDPILKLNLGGLYFGLNDFESADRVFEEVVLNKNDYANGWYNWAYSGKQLGKLEMAINRMKKALELVPADSTDYEAADKILTEWKKELEEKNKTNENKEIPLNEETKPLEEITPTP